MGMSIVAHVLGKKRLGGPPVLLAPMSGITDVGMRRAAQNFGASGVVSEMVDCDFYASGHAASRLRAEGEGIACHVVQIAGCVPARMAEAARLAEAQGAAAIDINMGCPAKSVVGGQAGSALMRDLERATALIRAAIGAVSVPVFLKMRLGWDEASLNAAALARRAEAEGVAMVSVHGRTRCQFYKGRADWAAIRAVVDAVAIPIVANGDCGNAGDARAMLAASGAAAVMIGRAAVGRPWLVGQVARALVANADGTSVDSSGVDESDPPVDRRRDAAITHYETLLSLYGVGQGVRHARKHLAGYATHAGVASHDPLHRALVTADDHRRVPVLLAEVFERAGAAGSPCRTTRKTSALDAQRAA